MEERCCEQYSGTGSDLESMAKPSSRVLAMLAEREKKIAEITTCPSPCTDGMVAIKVQLGDDRPVLHEVLCPILNPKCHYGATLRSRIDRHLASLMTARIGVPRRHVARFDRYISTVATKEAARWSTLGFLILSGKPYAAAWFVREYLKGRIGDPYKSEAREWRMRAESAASCVMWSSTQGIVGDRGVSIDAKRTSLLILDDLGKESELQSARAIVRDVISQRYDNELPTIVTTELTVADIDARYGRAIAERIIGESEDSGSFVTRGDASLRLIERSNAA